MSKRTLLDRLGATRRSEEPLYGIPDRSGKSWETK